MANTTTPSTDERIRAAIRRELEIAIEAAVQAEIAEAQKRVEAEVRKRVGAIATKVLSHYDLFRDGKDLMIRVRIGDEAK